MTCSRVIVSGRRRPSPARTWFVQASVARTTRPARWTRPVGRRDLVLAGDVSNGRDRRPVEERRAVGDGERPMGRVAAVRVGDARVGLVDDRRIVREAPLRPAPHRLGGIEPLEGHALRLEAAGVVGLVGDAAGREDVEAAGPGHDPFAARRLHLGPAGVGAPGQADVIAAVVREPDDPGVVARGAVGVVELELLEAQDAGPRPGGGPVDGRRSDRPEAHDDDVPLALHGRTLAGRPGPAVAGPGRGTGPGARARRRPVDSARCPRSARRASQSTTCGPSATSGSAPATASSSRRTCGCPRTRPRTPRRRRSSR